MLLPLPGPLDLALTFEGQAFRWHRRETWWMGVLGEDIVRLRVVPGEGAPCLEVKSAPTAPEPLRPRLEHYLGLDADMAATRTALAVEPRLAELLPRFGGLRILRQDPWESLASFLLSQNANIPRIQQMAERLAQVAGPAIHACGQTCHAFPSPEAVARIGERHLGALRLGYRAPYLAEAARRVVEGSLDLEALRRLPYEEARQTLLGLEGVGPKVADCVLAYGLGHGEAFPVDTWVERAVRSRWYSGQRISRERIAAWGRQRFGPHAAYAQLLLFHADRPVSGEVRPPAATR